MAKSIYISGPVSSCKSTYKQLFNSVATKLTNEEYIVINPALLPEGLKPDSYMPICLAMLDAADAIYMMKDWQKSKGSILEKDYAEYNQKEIIYEI